jgi:hypothetical protein
MQARFNFRGAKNDVAGRMLTVDPDQRPGRDRVWLIGPSSASRRTRLT